MNEKLIEKFSEKADKVHEKIYQFSKKAIILSQMVSQNIDNSDDKVKAKEAMLDLYCVFEKLGDTLKLVNKMQNVLYEDLGENINSEVISNIYAGLVIKQILDDKEWFVNLVNE